MVDRFDYNWESILVENDESRNPKCMSKVRSPLSRVMTESQLYQLMDFVCVVAVILSVSDDYMQRNFSTCHVTPLGLLADRSYDNIKEHVR